MNDFKNNRKCLENKKMDEKIPSGFRDIFPVEAEERNSIRYSIKEEFQLWGYGEIKTPVVEFTRNISAGVGKNWEDKLISFFDADGSLVSLRTDMTVPIARFSGMRIKKDQLPVRFCYFANSFRRSQIQKGEKREYNQAGLELIGSDSYICDVETLLIIINILKKLVGENFIIGLGDVSLAEEIYSWLDLNNQEREYVKHNLIKKNYVAIKEYMDKIDSKKAAIFLNLLKPEKSIEKIEKILKDTNSVKVLQRFNFLRTIYDILKDLNHSNHIIIDLGILKDFEYYTGLIFEAYSSNINAILGSGGRYDNLIKKFGLDVPATGFALDIDMLHMSMKESKLKIFNNKIKIMLYSENENYLKLLKLSENLRKKNIIVEQIFEKGKDLNSFAKDSRCDFLGIVDEKFEFIFIYNLRDDKKTTIKPEDLAKYIENETIT